MSERRVTPERFKAALMALHNAKTRITGMGLEAANPAELVHLVQEYLEDALHDLQLVDAENERLREEFGTLMTTVDFSLNAIKGASKELLEIALERARAALKEKE